MAVALQAKTIVLLLVIAAGIAGCATSADMSYMYRTNSATCTQLAREIAVQKGDSAYRRSINQRYYRECVGN